MNGAGPPTVRRYRAGDAPALADIFHAAVHGIACRDYTADQLAAWSPEVPDAARFAARATDGRTTWVAEAADGTALGFIELEADGHIDMFFCHPRSRGTGAGRALYAQLEVVARKRGLACLFVEASETARGFFARSGFALVARQTLVRRGVRLHNYRMEKRLA